VIKEVNSAVLRQVVQYLDGNFTGLRPPLFLALDIDREDVMAILPVQKSGFFHHLTPAMVAPYYQG
jgi:hypothetical protein